MVHLPAHQNIHGSISHSKVFLFFFDRPTVGSTQSKTKIEYRVPEISLREKKLARTGGGTLTKNAAVA